MSKDDEQYIEAIAKWRKNIAEVMGVQVEDVPLQNIPKWLVHQSKKDLATLKERGVLYIEDGKLASVFDDAGVPVISIQEPAFIDGADVGLW